MSDHGFSFHVDRLERIISRLTRPDAVLWVEREGSNYVVSDLANGDEVMLRHPSLDECVTWMRAFVAKTPGASIDEASVEVQLGAARYADSLRAAFPPDNVVPIRRAIA